ncbi:MAG: TonB-dependent receptor, partial [Bacteroidetes bacterium]|nr:TonB-dependent receptor [Bacteroidota bacterium]
TETEVGAYVDGVRRFPAGPLRMDSQVSHFDPSTIDRVEVVKGPYALIWGAGNMSAIRVHTKDVPRTTGLAQGTVRSSYDTNYGAVGLTGALYGAEDNVTYWAHGAYREGHNYEAGGGSEIPADYRSAEGRGKLSYHFAPGSRLTVAGGYQDQRDIDYPGRLLDADFFEAYDVSARYERTRSDGLLRTLDVLAYWHGVDHGMDNEEKPTRQAGQFPNGMPRPPLLITVDASMRNLGGRVAAELVPSEQLRLTVGGDLYSANRDAERPFFAVMPDGNTVVPPFYRGPDGNPLDEVWPDVTITDAGLFANARQYFGSVTASGTVRLDLVWADAARPTPVYLEAVGASDADDLSATETNWSAAATLSLPLDDAWTVSAGVGSVVRTADALERFADRFPASKAQTSAEFVGNPDLDPERATQADLWLEGVYPRLRLSLNGFYRVMDDYITLTPTDLDKLLPLSPDTVFRYVNGEATFYGGEATAAYAVLPVLTASVSASYLWGRDDALDEPALGVSPLATEIGLRYEPQSGRFFAEGGVNVVAEQDRVATTRGETATESYVTVDLRGGVEITRGVDLLVGVQNLTDAAYVNHLNAKNPFTGTPIPEPGRVLYTSLSLSF